VEQLEVPFAGRGMEQLLWETVLLTEAEQIKDAGIQLRGILPTEVSTWSSPKVMHITALFLIALN
jgi:hypothetical protein